MTIKDFFEKNINRNIETVIKADDRDNISTEVLEYVITNEIAKKIEDLFDSYNEYSGANGVWISGFFGSGKSHLLKILSYALENKEFNGFKSGELFAKKIEDNALLKANVLSATRIPSESILFNIDQQAQITSKTDANAILSVFYKVFYDHLGFYGFQPHVAEFEMWLDKQNKYGQFKLDFQKEHGKSWYDSRSDYFDPAITSSAAKVLSQIFEGNASDYEDILDKIEDNHKQSIEDFCQRVQEYIKLKPKGFRLNFFVDEVGQYISDNTRLMLNLQTIAETLATITRGNSWILVTSQEDMEKVVGDMSKSQENDFSRIQARFKIKVPLTSANVGEVIEKRLLKKNPEAQQLLQNTFNSESALLDTLLSFSDSGVQFKGYRTEKDFANKMPFVAYQFDLFQQCRIALSNHNAFQGKHASVGERSMLGVFQQVIQSIEDKNEHTLVTFDLMFNGIRNELKGQIQNSVTLAEKHLDNIFAVKILKTLFLVKYFGNFKTTKRNISVLMIDQINIDLKKHEHQVEEALNLLENQSYVQRNGEVYEFLTDDEKDIEEEIKNTSIDEQAVTQILKEIFFDEIIRDNKIKYLDNRQDYEFSGKIDGTTVGREKELEIEIITESFHSYDNQSFLQSQTMGTSGMKVVLPSNAIFMKDLKMYLRTDKYTKQSQSTANRTEVKRILQEKGMQNAERRRNLIIMANTSLASAAVYANGGKMELAQASDGRNLVISAFQNLIKTVYPNLRMLGSILFTEETFKKVIAGSNDDLFGMDDETMTEAEAEVLMIINRRKGQSDRTSLSDLKADFAKRPYGWYQNAIFTIVAKLYKRSKLEIKKDSNVLEDIDVIQALLNSSSFANTLLEPQAVIDPKLVKGLKTLYSELFNESCPFNDAKEVAKEFKAKLKALHTELAQYLARQYELPFLSVLSDFKETISRLLTKDYNYYLIHIKDFEDELLDNKEQYLDPIKRFINGDQLKIYESIKELISGDFSNFDYIQGEEYEQLKALIAHPKPYIGNLIKDGKAAKDQLTSKVSASLAEERRTAIQTIQDMIDDFHNKEEFNKLESTSQKQITAPFQAEIDKLQSQRYIAVIRDLCAKATQNLLPKQLTEMMRLSTPAPTGSEDQPQPPTTSYVTRASIKVDYHKTELRTESDVNEYVEALKKAFIDQIKETRRISL